MDLPRNLEFVATMFARMGNGGHQQVKRNGEYGITITSTKQDRDHPWVTIYEVDRFSGKVFKSGKEVVDAFREI